MIFSEAISLDYEKFLNELNLTEEDMQKGKAVTYVKCSSLPSERYVVSPSMIEGLGVIAVEDICGVVGEFHTSEWEVLGRYTNHSPTPTGIVIRDRHSNDILLLADVKKGQEITVDYRQVKEVLDGRL